MGLIAHDKRHGGAFDCGSADNYYGRPFAPHFWTNGTGKSLRIGAAGMTETEIAAYAAGWADNEESGGKKEWG
jgi:hypothetical protein